MPTGEPTLPQRPVTRSGRSAQRSRRAARGRGALAITPTLLTVPGLMLLADAASGGSLTDEETQAWFYNPEGAEDQTTPHQFVPNRPVTPVSVRAMGMIIWKLSAENYVENPLLENIKKERGYTHSDVITFSPDHIDDFEAKAANFLVERHQDTDEVRFVLEGTGYFDVRDLEENWIRVKIVKGDFVIVPPGICHRFTLDETLYIKALRFFKELPEFTDET